MDSKYALCFICSLICSGAAFGELSSRYNYQRQPSPNLHYFWLSLGYSVNKNNSKYSTILLYSRLKLMINFFGPPDGSQRAICLCLVRPSVRPWESKFFCLKTRFMGFWEGLGCFWRFRLLSVRACVRYALCTKFCGLNLS